MKRGFYEELEELREDDISADFGFLENVSITEAVNAHDFLHGLCDEFAAMLSDVFGYKIECIRHCYNEENSPPSQLIHAYCVSEINGEKAYIDIRGITTDEKLFFEEFEDEFTRDPETDVLWDLDGPLVFELWDSKNTLFDGDYEGWSDEAILRFISDNSRYYNTALLERKPDLTDQIKQVSVCSLDSANNLKNHSKEYEFTR